MNKGINFDFSYKFSEKSPCVRIGRGTITVDRLSFRFIGGPDKVAIGYSEDAMAIAIKPWREVFDGKCRKIHIGENGAGPTPFGCAAINTDLGEKLGLDLMNSFRDEIKVCYNPELSKEGEMIVFVIDDEHIISQNDK